jgi:hypothetical protein
MGLRDWDDEDDERIRRRINKLYPDRYIDLAKQAIWDLRESFSIQAWKLGGVILPSERQRDKADALQRTEHLVNALDCMADAPAAYTCCILTCGCCLLDTMSDRLQHICDEHLELIGGRNMVAGWIARALYDAYREDSPEVAKRFRDNVQRDAKEFAISGVLRAQLLELLSEGTCDEDVAP